MKDDLELGPIQLAPPVEADYQRRIAAALERIASALEWGNAARTWPTTQVGGQASATGGLTCSRCGTWYLGGTVHYCAAGAR